MTENREIANNAAAVDGGVNNAASRKALAEIAAICDGADTGGLDAIVAIYNIAKAALAAPQRNCDLFDSCAEAKAEWWKVEVLPRVYGVVSGAEPPFTEWLYGGAERRREVKKLKRDKCAVLHLGLKYHWYRLIDSGTKKVEFREVTPYWQVRVANWIRRWRRATSDEPGKIPVLEFQNGYGRFSPRMAFIAGGAIYDVLDAKTPVRHKELGEFPKKRYVFFIGERIQLED